MNFFSIIFAVLGLGLFETVSSIDNAIINAEVLAGMGQKARRWFLVWGFLFAVVAVRGVLPWLIVWMATPGIGPLHAFTAAFSSDPGIRGAVQHARPLLFAGGGLFLVFLFFHWLFLEPKNFGLPGEQFMQRQGVWFFAVASAILAVTVWLALRQSPAMAFAAVLGSTAFFITHGFKQNAEAGEQKLKDSSLSDLSKILYLEIIDSTFSIDGVLGAFAFTLSVPVILIGNGLGAYVVRRFTVGNMEAIRRLAYIKNGAMYSILFLGCAMLLEAFGVAVPQWMPPVITFVVVGYFYLKSK